MDKKIIRIISLKGSDESVHLPLPYLHSQAIWKWMGDQVNQDLPLLKNVCVSLTLCMLGNFFQDFFVVC